MSLKNIFTLDNTLFNLNLRFTYYVQNHSFPNKDLSLRDFNPDNSIAVNSFAILDAPDKYLSIYKEDFPKIKKNLDELTKIYLAFCSGESGNKILTNVLERESPNNTIYDYYLNKDSDRILINKNELSRLIKSKKEIPLESFSYGGILGSLGFANNYLVSSETFTDYSNLISGISFFILGSYVGLKNTFEKSELNLASRLSQYVETNKEEIKSLRPVKYSFESD